MKTFRRFYYSIKPFLPWRLRLAVRRSYSNYVRNRHQADWPIFESAGNTPAGWSGWPQGKQFAVVLTHDVEGPIGWDRIERVAQLEGEAGFRSSFNLIPKGSYTVTRNKREWLTSNDFEVGVHDLYHDGKLYRSYDHFQDHAREINHYLAEWNAVGFRSGFMLHNLDWIRELNLLYDASTFDFDPFEPQPEGVGTIFPVSVPGARSRPGYVELPYTLVQDSTLFLLLQERTADLWKQKVDWIASRGGMVLVNVHPDYLAFEGERATARQFSAGYYLDLLTYVKDRYEGEYWHVLPRDLAVWFKARAS